MASSVLNIYVDLSGSNGPETWLPEVSKQLHSALRGLAVDDAVTVRCRGFAAEVTPRIELRLTKDAPLEDALDSVYIHLRDVAGGDQAEYAAIWSEAKLLIAAGESCVVLSDLNGTLAMTGARGELSRPPHGIRYVQYKTGVRPIPEELFTTAENFIRVYELAYCASPIVDCAKRPEPVNAAESEQLMQWLTHDLLSDAAPREIEYEKDSAEIASEEGFAGTLWEFFDWLRDSLVYGGIRVSDPKPNEWGRLEVTVETSTGGFSSDEHLLGRVERIPWMVMSWRSSHAGGRTAFRFSVEQLDNAASTVVLKPEDEDPVGVYARTRTLRVEDPEGGFFVASFDNGVELLFSEPERDICEPAGVLTIRPWSSTL